MYISTEETINYLFEEKLDVDLSSIKDKFTYNPKGILIQDTYNNPFFPINPMPTMDTSKLNIKEVYQRFFELYNQKKSIFLPWHYCVEFIDDKYYIFNTRPINLKFPLNNNNINRNDNWNINTEMFFDDNIFDISDAIHICIIGNTKIDVYTKSCYELIGKICIKPMMTYFKLPGVFQRVFFLNIGKRFNATYLERFSLI